jgi:hypothetical protein
MKVHQLLLGTSLLSLTLLAGGALAQETPDTPSSPGAAISQAARQGGSRAISEVARENAPGTARSAEARAAAGQPDDDQDENANENSGIGGEVSAFAKDAQGEGVSDFALENSPGIDKANEVHANAPASIPAARPTLPSTARATLPTLPTRPNRPQLPTVPPRH